MLAIWSVYAFSGAGALGKLACGRVVLCAITGIYLLRGVAFVFLMPYFPGNSVTFWVASSAICLGIGIVHGIGLKQVWWRL
ncbi:MAG: hypothetical protein ACTS5I_10870 [Rhodanobacter sp.]